MIRVLQIGLSFERGGVESFVMNYYRHINREKIQFDFINPYDKPLAYEDEILRLGGKIFRVTDFHSHPVKYKKDLEKIMLAYDVVHIHMLSAANIIPLKVAKRLGVKKIIAHSHNSKAEGLIRKILHKINYKKNSYYATNCYSCSKLAGDWMFGKNKYYEIIKNGIESEKYAYNNESRIELRKEFGINNDAVVYGNVGRLNIQKNQSFLLKVFSKIHQIQPNSYLCIVGEGELRKDLTEFSKKLNIQDRVLMVGRRGDVHKFYSFFDSIIMPSIFEGLPVTLIEAQANGLKCFVSKGAISYETKILETMEFIDLNEGEDKWAEKILQADLQREKSALEKINDAHFDIASEVETLEKKYFGI